MDSLIIKTRNPSMSLSPDPALSSAPAIKILRGSRGVGRYRVRRNLSKEALFQARQPFPPSSPVRDARNYTINWGGASNIFEDNWDNTCTGGPP